MSELFDRVKIRRGVRAKATTLRNVRLEKNKASNEVQAIDKNRERKTLNEHLI